MHRVFYLAVFLVLFSVSVRPQAESANVVPLTVKIQNLTRTPTSISFEAVAANRSSDAIYVAIDPKDKRVEVYYRWLDEKEAGTLHVGSRLFGPIYPTPTASSVSVRLKKLEPDGSETFHVKLVMPIDETVPPTDVLFFDEGDALVVPFEIKAPKRIDLKKIEIVNFHVGYFVERSAIDEFLHGQSPEFRTHGNYRLHTSDGKRVTLLGLQKIASASLLTNSN